MAGMDFSTIAASWKDCTGYSPMFASQQIETYVPLRFGSLTTQTWSPFVSPRLKEALFHEAQHYIDRSLYHLITGKWMICEGRLSWGLVSYYYSTFFAAQAAIRLKGIFFVKVNYDRELGGMPTHRLEVVNLLRDEFRIRQASSRTGEHARVWNEFFESFGAGTISSRPSWVKYSPVTDETDPELRVVEMHRRHLINYVPGHGYHELRSPKDAAELKSQLSGPTCDNLVRALSHEDQQLEVRAYLRLSMCLQILGEIARQGGVYEIQHPKLTDKRLGWIDSFECPTTLSGRLASALAA